MVLLSQDVSPDPPREVQVLAHDSYPLGMNGAEVHVLEQLDYIRLGGLLERQEAVPLKAEFRVFGAGYRPDESLEGESTH